MNSFWSFIIYSLPWYVQAGFLLIVVAALVYLAAQIFGWERVRPFVIPIIGFVVLLVTFGRVRQIGYKDREDQEHVAVDKATDEFEQIHRKNEGLSDAEIDKKNDPWLRP